MPELNLNQITEKLNVEFAGESRKLIFWYDSNGDFKDDIDTLSLTNAKVYHLEPDNQFKTKYFLECVDKTTSYLVYAPFAKPAVRDNHLADTLKYSKEFNADRISMIMLDLRIDERLKPCMQKHSVFFKEKERIKKFYDAGNGLINESMIEIALMSVICKSRTTSFEEVVRCILTDDGLVNNKYIAEFEKYDLISAFWEHCEDAFGYTAPNPTLEKLVMTLFATYASKTLRTDVPQAWASFVSYKAGNIIAFLDNLMNSCIYSGRFDEISESIDKSLTAKAVFDKMPTEAIADCNIFASTDRILIDWMIARLENEDINAKLNKKSISELCEARRKMHFGGKYENEYLAVENAYGIISGGSYLPVSGIDNVIKQYTNSDYKTDRYYRCFNYYYDKLEDNSGFEKLRELVENVYTNEYLNKIAVNWTRDFSDANGDTALVKQKNFYNAFVNTVKERVVVIISDALRYEVGVSLFKKLQLDEKCTVSICAMQSVLPSITRFGMAAMLPHKTLEFIDSKQILVDGAICDDTLQREVQLQKYVPNSRCIQYDDLKQKISKTALDKYFNLGKNLNQRDTIAVRKMVGGFLKLIYPDGVYTKEELEEVIIFSLEMRRRVKEQLKKLGGMEFYDVNFSYIDNETFEEHYVSVPEQGGGKLIPEGFSNPGQAYTVSQGKTGMIGVFRLESQMLPGNGKFERTGIGSDRGCKEATNTAFNFLKANSNCISGSISTTMKDYIINYQDLQGIGMTSKLALPTLIALCSIALGKPVLSSMAILGEISISGTLIKAEELANSLQVCLDSGAKKVLIPATSMVDFATVPPDLMSAFQLIPYQSAEDAVFKALGVE